MCSYLYFSSGKYWVLAKKIFETADLFYAAWRQK